MPWLCESEELKFRPVTVPDDTLCRTSRGSGLVHSRWRGVFVRGYNREMFSPILMGAAVFVGMALCLGFGFYVAHKWK